MMPWRGEAADPLVLLLAPVRALARLLERVSSWLFTVACCLAGSICMSGVPAVTRSPGCTKISVIWPSTCGMITADSRDLSVATYSLASSTLDSSATWILTGMPPGPWGPAFCFAQADANATKATPVIISATATLPLVMAWPKANTKRTARLC